MLNNGLKVGVYCSDASGAFDHVPSERLLAKLESKGLSRSLLEVIKSWLGIRDAFVVVGGEKSHAIKLANMVFQGTVWGPEFWNVYFEDSRRAVQASGFSEGIYADDLNAFK